MKIITTGSDGMLGQDLIPILKENDFDIIPTTINDLDITNEKAVKDCINKNNPDFIIHLAAYTNVDGAESNKDIAFLINETGTSYLAKYSAEKNIPILYISTDYVFDGTKNAPYQPNDKTCPINVYGESKLKGEEAVKKLNPKHYIVRTSWLYGIHGKNFVETMINLGANNPEIRVVKDQVGCPTSTIALSNAIVKILKENKPYGTYHACGSGFTSWHGFAKKIMELMSIDTNVIPVTSEEFVRPAKRPAYSIMENSGLCPNWEESLKEYVARRNK